MILFEAKPIYHVCRPALLTNFYPDSIRRDRDPRWVTLPRAGMSEEARAGGTIANRGSALVQG
jgi:hypothetical protein